MLSQAFVETHDFQALTTTNDFNLVVGRRGTGKTALFLKVFEFYNKNPGIFLDAHSAEEDQSIALVSFITDNIADDYRTVRSTMRVTWRAVILLDVLQHLKSHWKLRKVDEDGYLASYCRDRIDLVSARGIARCITIIRRYAKITPSRPELPATITNELDLANLEKHITMALSGLNQSAVILFDGLDEGWGPSPASTAVLGGLALAVADFKDRCSGIHTLLFVRDNLFRALANLDPDFSRHIEGATLRLHWDESGLLLLVARRLRVALRLDMENDIRIWNRFAQRELQTRSGFTRCLHYTLYRPRDILVLLNQAFHLAARGGRYELIEDDIEAVSKQISESRLSDLLKEYENVFPGLGVVVNTFRGRASFFEVRSLIGHLNTLVNECDYSEVGSGDLAILNSGETIFYTLYSIGFLGLQDSKTATITFRHDGGAAAVTATEVKNQQTTVHPCYWKALGLTEAGLPLSILSEIHDEYELRVTHEVKDIRTRQLGKLVSELPSMPEGPDGARDFEDWAFRTVRILFSGLLVNPELKPNDGAIQQRDIVATNMAESGFWRRVLEDYGSRQIVFEIKNYQNLKFDDYRQVLSYTANEYGKFALIVTRSSSEGVGDTERGWMQSMYHEHKRVIMTLPANLLSRYVRKVRNIKKHDYCDKQLTKRLDLFLRSYLALKHSIPRKRRGPKIVKRRTPME